METTSPFKAIQDLQDQQREGWMPEDDSPKTDTPETDAFYRPDFQTYPTANFSRKLERERNEARQQVAELTHRLNERRESFQAQIIRIEDTWREKLSNATKDAARLAAALDPIAWLHSMPEDGKAFNEAEEAMMAHEALTNGK